MDQAFLEREKELFKLNAKLNSKARKIATNSNKSFVKPVQIHTANNYFNYYDESMAMSQKDSQGDGLQLMCKKINISNQPAKKNHEIVYPLLNRQAFRVTKDNNTNDIHIHLPEGSKIIPDGQAHAVTTEDVKSETIDDLSFKNESVLKSCSGDLSAAALAKKDLGMPILPTANSPTSIEKKNISNDGLLK